MQPGHKRANSSRNAGGEDLIRETVVGERRQGSEWHDMPGQIIGASRLLLSLTLGLATLSASLRTCGFGQPAVVARVRVPALRANAAASPGNQQNSASDALAVRVRDAILDEEERPYMIWNEEGPKPLKINLDLLNYRAKQLERKGQVCA